MCSSRKHVFCGSGGDRTACAFLESLKGWQRNARQMEVGATEQEVALWESEQLSDSPRGGELLGPAVMPGRTLPVLPVNSPEERSTLGSAPGVSRTGFEDRRAKPKTAASLQSELCD